MSDSNPNRITVMSYNVRGACRDVGTPNEWPKRAELNLSVVQSRQPDVVGFQEMQPGNIEYYNRNLPGYSQLQGPKTNDHEPYEYNVVIYNDERVELLGSGGFWLSETPDEHSASWDTACIRAANFARFRLKGTETEWVHLNTHLDHVSEQARAEGARLITSKLRDLFPENPAVMLTGDFNCEPGSAAYQEFLGAGFQDTFEVADEPSRDPQNTFHGFNGNAFKPWAGSKTVRIDWILVRDGSRKIAPVSFSIIRDAALPQYPSDHYPIIATVDIS